MCGAVFVFLYSIRFLWEWCQRVCVNERMNESWATCKVGTPFRFIYWTCLWDPTRSLLVILTQRCTCDFVSRHSFQFGSFPLLHELRVRLRPVFGKLRYHNSKDRRAWKVFCFEWSEGLFVSLWFVSELRELLLIIHHEQNGQNKRRRRPNITPSFLPTTSIQYYSAQSPLSDDTFSLSSEL